MTLNEYSTKTILATVSGCGILPALSVTSMSNSHTDLVYRLQTRAKIRRQIPTRKSVQENKSDRIADLLEEAAVRIQQLEAALQGATEAC